MFGKIQECALLIFAALYRAAYLLHHRFFLKPGVSLCHANFFVVGSFRAGGAGKTPFCIWLVKRIKEKYPKAKVAVLCHRIARDEIDLIQSNFLDVRVIATANRYSEARKLDGECDYIVCDDGFEDSRLTGASVIRLDWEDAPTNIRGLIPLGKNRSLVQDHGRPAVVLKCGTDIAFSIACIKNFLGKGFPVGVESGGAVALCGIGDPERFAENLKSAGVCVSRLVCRPDHDRNFARAVKKILRTKSKVIITEKDFSRIKNLNVGKDENLFVAYQKVEASDSAKSILDKLI